MGRRANIYADSFRTIKTGQYNMERRENDRLPVRDFKEFKQKRPRNYPYKILNISKSGCSLESKEALKTRGGSVVFELPLPVRADSVTLVAKIV